MPSIKRSWPWDPTSVLDRNGAKSTMISLNKGQTDPRARSSFCVSVASLDDGVWLWTETSGTVGRGVRLRSSGRSVVERDSMKATSLELCCYQATVCELSTLRGHTVMVSGRSMCGCQVSTVLHGGQHSNFTLHPLSAVTGTNVSLSKTTATRTQVPIVVFRGRRGLQVDLLKGLKGVVCCRRPVYLSRRRTGTFFKGLYTPRLVSELENVLLSILIGFLVEQGLSTSLKVKVGFDCASNTCVVRATAVF